MPTEAELNQAAAILDRVARNLKGASDAVKEEEDQRDVQAGIRTLYYYVNSSIVDIHKAAELVRR